MDDQIKALLALVRSGLWERPADGAGMSGQAGYEANGPAGHEANGRPGCPDWNALSEADWAGILETARKQTVCGLVYRGVALLPEEVQVPDSIVFPLITEADRVIRQSRTVSRAAEQLVAFFEGRSLHPLILKGPSVAVLYPKPELRESGDIDVFFTEKEFGKAVHAIRERLTKMPGPAGNDKGTENDAKAARKDGETAGNDAKAADVLRTLPDGSIHYDWNGVDIDQHPKYFDLDAAPDILPEVPSPEATLLMLSAHILKHCMGAGIGLRQLCDMAIAYQALPYDRERLLACYQATGTDPWNRLLASFLVRYLGAEDIPYESPKELPDPAPLLDIVLTGGNFGHHEQSRSQALQASPLRRKADTAGRFLRRLPFSLRYAPKQLAAFFKELVRGNLSV